MQLNILTQQQLLTFVDFRISNGTSYLLQGRSEAKMQDQRSLGDLRRRHTVFCSIVLSLQAKISPRSDKDNHTSIHFFSSRPFRISGRIESINSEGVTI